MGIENVQNEVLFVASFFRNPDLYIEFGRSIVSQYDLSDEVTKFLYDNFELYYKTFSQTIDETKVNTFMSQDIDRLKQYRKYGGYKLIKTWMDLCDLDDFSKYMEVVKKYSLLREFDRKGFDVNKIMNHKRFNTMKAEDVVRVIRGGVDKVSTVIMANESSTVINTEMNEAIMSWIDKPSVGVLTPFEQFNDLFRGFKRGKFFVNAMLSNAGKSRLMILFAAYLALVKEEKVLVLANEMCKDDFKACLLVTVINSSHFKELHGIDITKPEREIVMGMYRDANGKFIQRIEDEEGNFAESSEDYISRLYRDSDEYRKVTEVANWIETQTENKILFKQLYDYSDDVLDTEIRKHKLIYGTNYVFYDTLKPYLHEEWGVFKQTCTKLSTLAIELDIFMYGSAQMTDNTVFTDIFALSSNNIASAKSNNASYVEKSA